MATPPIGPDNPNPQGQDRLRAIERKMGDPSNQSPDDTGNKANIHTGSDSNEEIHLEDLELEEGALLADPAVPEDVLPAEDNAFPADPTPTSDLSYNPPRGAPNVEPVELENVDIASPSNSANVIAPAQPADVARGGPVGSIPAAESFSASTATSITSTPETPEDENTPPNANNDIGSTDDTHSTFENAVLNINALDGILSNDNDPDNDPLTITQINGNAASVGNQITLQSGALLTVNADGSYIYDPNNQFDSLNTGQTATDSFTYQVSDGEGGFDTATVEILIKGLSTENQGPDALNDSNSTDEDTTLNVLSANGVLINDSDPNGDPLIVSAVNGNTSSVGNQITLASGALLTLNSDGSYVYDPNGQFESLQVGQSATDSFNYTISDGQGGSDTATVEILINGVNDPPDAQNDIGALDDSFETDEDTSISVLAADGVLANDADPEGDPLTVTAVNGNASSVGTQITLASGALLTLNADGSYDYDPNGVFDSLNFGQTATDSFNYTISDGQGGTDTATVEILINGLNEANLPPDAINDNNSTDEDTSISVLAANGLLINDSDPESDPILITAVNGNTLAVGNEITLASGALLTVNPDGSYVYNPNGQFESLQVGQSATDSFNYTISDGQGGFDTATVNLTINGVNDPPDAQNDIGALDDSFETDEDTSISVLAADGVLANDADPEGDPLTVTAVNGNASSVGTQITLASGALLTLNADGSYDYDPNGVFDSLNFGQTATDSFNYTISDGHGGTDTATVEILINGLNEANLPPDAINDNNSTDEDTSISVLAANGLLINDSDPESDPILITAVNGNTLAVGNEITLASGALLTVNPDGSYVYNPNGQFESLQVGQSATDSFNYTISDGQGGFDTATVNLTINGVNDPPDAQNDIGALDDSFETDEDTSISVLAADGVLANDADPEGDPLTVTAVNGNASSVGTQITLASGALLTLNADGSYDYDPNGVFDSLNFGQTATDSFNYTISDGHGGTDTATVEILINGLNEANLPPDAINDNNSTDEDTSISVLAANGLLINDSDPESDPILITAVNGNTLAVGNEITLASGALLTVNPDGSYVYNPNGQFESLQVGQSATDSFNYTISDGQGGFDTATVNLTINGVNDPPDAQNDIGALDDSFETDEDTSISVLAADGVLANDADPEGDPLTVTAVNGNASSVGTQITLASGALLTLNADGSYDYDPNGVFDSLNFGQTATDSFNYTISDGHGGTDTATVEILINGLNEANLPPDAINDNNSTDEDTSISVLAANGLLINDSDPESDPILITAVNGNTLAVGNEITLASGALLTVNPDGSYVYNPNGQFESLQVGQSATDSFNYTISDGQGGFDTATVNLTINGVNDPPDAQNDIGALDDSFETDEDTSISVLAADGVLANDADPEGDPLTVTAVNGNASSVGTQITLASGALLILNADGSYDYDPNGVFDFLEVGETANDNFSYTLSDGEGGTDTANVQILINGVHDGGADDPNLAVEHAFGDEDTAIPLNIDASLMDLSGTEQLTIQISGVLPEASLSAGTDQGNGTWLLEPSDLNGLTITPPPDYPVGTNSGIFDLTVTAISTEISSGDTSSVSQILTVDVNAVADAPILTADGEIVLNIGDNPNTTTKGSSGHTKGTKHGSHHGTTHGSSGRSQGSQGTSHGSHGTHGGGSTAGDTSNTGPIEVPLTIEAALTDLDGSEMLNIVISDVPEGVILSAGIDNGDGSWSLSSEDLNGLTMTIPETLGENDDFDLTVTAISTEFENHDTASTSTIIHVDLQSGSDPGTPPPGGSTGGTHGGTHHDHHNANAHQAHLDHDDDHDNHAYDTDNAHEAHEADEHLHVDGDHAHPMPTGTDESESLLGSNMDEHIHGQGGDDTLKGKGGDDELYGDEGNDILKGDGGDDILSGGAGDDAAFGGQGNDIYEFGLGDGQDTFNGGSGENSIHIMEMESGPGMGVWDVALDDPNVTVEQHGNSLDFSSSSSGVISMADGSELVFTNVTHIDWS